MRLALIVGMPFADYLDAFDRVNLVNRWPGPSKTGKGDRVPPRRALRRAAERLAPKLRGRDVVFLGREVAAAFDAGEFVPLRKVWLRGFDAVLVPHPSGVCRWWNDPANRTAARAVLRPLGLQAARI